MLRFLPIVVVVLFFALLLGTCCYNHATYRYCIEQSRSTYYTNSYRQEGNCLIFEAYGESTRVCGGYTIRQINP